MTNPDPAQIERAAAVLPITAAMLDTAVRTIREGVKSEYRRQRLYVGRTGEWWSAPGIILRGSVAQWRLFMLKVCLCLRLKRLLTRQIEALTAYLGCSAS